jgi:hypothetical protein
MRLDAGYSCAGFCQWTLTNRATLHGNSRGAEIMSGQGQHQPKRPENINGFRAGDKVTTSLGRPATITGCRLDGYLDAVYDDRHPSLADVILQPQLLRKMK